MCPGPLTWACPRAILHISTKGHTPTHTMTTRQALILLATVLATFGGIGAYQHLSNQAAAHECVAQGYDRSQCWQGR